MVKNTTETVNIKFIFSCLSDFHVRHNKASKIIAASKMKPLTGGGMEEWGGDAAL